MPPEGRSRKAGKCIPPCPIGNLRWPVPPAKCLRVKWLSLFLLVVVPAKASLLATMQTSRGSVVIDLQYTKAPQAVANFITLSQGTRAWVDPSTGAVKKSPFYNGLKIHRVVNDTSFKIVQGGSPKGDGTDGPGFTFKDEFDATLTHVPYVFSMANAGPNTNGSQFFFTGNVSIPSLNNVHTVFGLVTDTASRAIVDAMLAAGANNTTITGVTFSRTDPAAVAFDEFAQNLPTVIRPDGNLVVNRNAYATWNLNPVASTGAVFRAYRSTTLVATPNSWVELTAAARHVGITPPATTPTLVSAPLDDASNPKAFYNLSVANHPGSVAPSTLANRTVTLPLGADTLTFTFGSSGTSGTTVYSPQTGLPISGVFNTVSPATGLAQAPTSSAHNISFTTDTPAINPRYFWVKIGTDSATSTTISGHHSSQYFHSLFGWQPFASGPATITR